VALSAALLAGCGGSSDDAASAGGDSPAATTPTVAPLPVDAPQKRACGLVTQAEVEAAIGARVTPGREDVQAARSFCSFSLASAADQSVAVVSTSSSGVPAAFDAALRALPSAQPVRAGDQAFVSGGQAVVRKGDTMVAILVALRRDAAQLTVPATRLAEAVGARL
jgi:hypothetical protein